MLYSYTSNWFKNYKRIECTILDIFNQSLMSSFTSSTKSFPIQHLIDNFCLQAYLKRQINYNGKKV